MAAAVIAILIIISFAGVFAADDNMDFYISLSAMVNNYVKDDFVSTVIMQINSNTMSISGKEIPVDEDSATTPLLVNDITMIPLRAICEALGYNVSYDDDSGRISIQYGDMTAEMYLGKSQIKISYDNGVIEDQIIDIKAEPIINDFDRTMVPARATVENIFAGGITWKDEDQTIYITKDYQTKRLVVMSDDPVMDFSEYGPVEIIKDEDNMYVLQFDMNTPDILVKQYCDEIGKREGVEFAEPDCLAAVE